VLRNLSDRRSKKKKEKVIVEPREHMELAYLKSLYKLDLRKINKKKVMYIATTINAFIIALTSAIVMLIEEFIMQMIIAFLLIVGLITLSYHILGTYLKRKEG